MGPALLDDHGPVRLLDRPDDRVEVERAQRPGVDHLRLDTMLVGEGLRRLHGHLHHPQDRDDGHVRAVAADSRLTEVDDTVAVLGNLAAQSVERFVLDEDDGVVVADRRLEQALAVGWRWWAGAGEAPARS